MNAFLNLVGCLVALTLCGNAKELQNEEQQKLQQLVDAPHVFVVDINKAGVASVSRTIRTRSKEQAIQIIAGIEAMKWPGGKRSLLVFRYEGDEALAKSGVYRIINGNLIRADMLAFIEFENVLANRPTKRILPSATGSVPNNRHKPRFHPPRMEEEEPERGE